MDSRYVTDEGYRNISDYVWYIKSLGFDKKLVPHLGWQQLKHALLRTLVGGIPVSMESFSSTTVATINRTIEDRSFFITEQGRMGICASSCFRSTPPFGRHIYALMGAPGLFLLDDQATHLFCDVYVDGLMDFSVSLEAVPNGPPETWDFEIVYLMSSDIPADWEVPHIGSYWKNE